MFTGIIESLGVLKRKEPSGENVRFYFSCNFLNELRIDQSVAHNGVCLTVDGIQDDTYSVMAIPETLLRTNLGRLKEGEHLNLERGMRMGDRLDGHLVQGHVDGTGRVKAISEHDGSREFFIESSGNHITVEKGSICVNGVSLTVVQSGDSSFSVAIIPYTNEHTTFQFLNVGDEVNLEYDIVGKYIEKLFKIHHS